jgi:pimeloyl-ACP methyl ester carboxylesterase
MPYADSQGVHIHYKIEGKGSPLVIQHGFTSSLQRWYMHGYVEALKDAYQLILLDARGHGASVDGAYPIIVACDVSAEARDKQPAVPMAELTAAHLEQAGLERSKDAQGVGEKIPGTYDSGYYSEAAAAAVEPWGVDPYMATGR